MRKNSAIVCLISHYSLGNDMSQTCYWEMPEVLNGDGLSIRVAGLQPFQKS